MAFPENQQHNPIPAPPFPSAGDHEMRDYYAAQDAPRPTSQQEPYLTPYLGLRARLSQVSCTGKSTLHDNAKLTYIVDVDKQMVGVLSTAFGVFETPKLYLKLTLDAGLYYYYSY